MDIDAALRDSEVRFRALAEAIREVFYLSDLRVRKLLYVSPAFEAIWGTPVAELLARERGYADSIHPDDQAAARAAYDEQAEGVETEVEYRIVRPDGEERWILDRSFPIRDEQGRPKFAAGVAEDITGRKRAEQALRESEARFRKIADSAPVPMWVTQVDRKRSFVNRAYVEFLGISYEEAVDFDWRHIIHPDDGERILSESVAGEASLKPFTLEGRFRRGDGQLRWLRSVSQPRWGPEGEFAGFIGVAHDVTEAKQAEAALRENAEQLRLIADSLPVLISFVDARRRYRFANRAYEDWFGRPREAVIGKTLAEVLGDSAYAAVAPHVDRALAGERVAFETLIPYREAGPRHVRVDYVPALDGGAVTGFYALVSDVSEAKRAEKALREASERAAADAAERAAILQQLAEGVIVTDAEGRISFVNAAAAAIHGVERLDVAPDDYSETYRLFTEDGEPYPSADLPLARAVRDGTTVADTRWRIRRPDGSEVLAIGSAQPIRSPDGAQIGAVLTLRDDTARRAAEDALLESNRTLETLNRSGAALAGELDLQRVVQLVTDAGVELTGASFGAFFHNVTDDAGESYMLYTLSGVDRAAFEGFPMPRNTAVFGPTFRGEGVVRSDDILADARYGKSEPHRGLPEGHLPVRSYLAVPVTSRSGEVVGGLFFAHPEPGRFTERHETLMLGLAAQAAIAMDNARLYEAAQREIADRATAEQRLKELNETLEARVAEEIAERLKAEETLRQAQKMEAIGQLTGGIAHDFNNLLTVILSSVHLLKRPGLDPDKQARYVEAIGDTANRAAALTNQLLAFARRQPLQNEAFDICKRLKAMEPMLRTVLGAKIALSLTLDRGACLIDADPNQLDTAVLNMAVNARDAMPEGGALTIAAAPAEDGQWIDIRVTDTGTGIAREALATIFEPFYTTKSVGKGTGLGLSQVYGFAKQSGGEISVESELGRGASFVLRLPRSRRDAASDRAQAEDAAPDVGSARVLVVEDNREVGEAAVRLLEDGGHQVTLARDAAEALDRVLKRGEAFDLVFSDVIMPGPIDGLGLARLLREQRPDLPVVLTTGYSHSLAEDAAHGFELLRKPYRADALMRLVARVALKAA